MGLERNLFGKLKEEAFNRKLGLKTRRIFAGGRGSKTKLGPKYSLKIFGAFKPISAYK